MSAKRSAKSSSHDRDRSPLRELLDRGEEVVNVFLDELTGGASLRDEIEGAVQRANRARATVDKNMEAMLSALNLPTRRDYKRLVDEIHALQGSIVNLSMKMDRLIAQAATPPARFPGGPALAGSELSMAAAKPTATTAAKPTRTTAAKTARKRVPRKAPRGGAVAKKSQRRTTGERSGGARKRA